MNTKLIMFLSALFLGLAGLLFSFLPEEIAAYLDMSTTSDFKLILQLLGALYFGFAMLNWMAKGSILGGIYNRPLVIANFAHFFIGGLALLKELLSDLGQPVVVWLIAGIYLIFAILFGTFLFRHPLPEKK